MKFMAWQEMWNVLACRQGKKSDLLTCLEQSTQPEPPSSLDIKVLDGAAVVHYLSTGNSTTFNDYAR